MVSITELVRNLRLERDRLDRAIAALAPLAATLNGRSRSGSVNGVGRTMSVAARRRIAAAQRARWAKVRARSAGKAESKAGPKSKRVLSAAGRKRIAAAQRARWAKVRQRQTQKAA